ncbi:MAG: hypothetical protein K2G07_04335, partial [Muribaculaceae bacterium]|nr:hypothetical protein [Muribaculaceae bacterium]
MVNSGKPAFVKRDLTIASQDYVQLLRTLKERFRNTRIKAAVSINTSLLEFYWSMGRDHTNRHQLGDDFELQRIINSIR